MVTDKTFGLKMTGVQIHIQLRKEFNKGNFWVCPRILCQS